MAQPPPPPPPPPPPSASPPTRRRRRGDERRSTCPVACALDVVGDRWTLLLVRDLLRGKSRYSDFLGSPEHIPTNILADRLKRLEQEGLITSTPYSEHPRRFEYRLTDEGRALGRAVTALARWGLRHFPGTVRPAGFPGPADSAAGS
jgi:DNA-binding HxlR family transcriptional regulator